MDEYESEDLRPVLLSYGYTLVQRIGYNLNGSLYLIKKDQTNRCLQMIYESAALKRKIDSTYMEEVTKLKEFRHPNMLKIHDFFEAHNHIFIIYDYFVGHTLSDVLRICPKLPKFRIVAIMKQLADVLDFCHKNSIFHNDINTHNILVNEFDNIRLSFFDINCAFQQFRSGQEQLESICYKPPEMFNHNLTNSAKSDVWSLGIIFYELTAGKRPFDPYDHCLRIEHQILLSELKIITDDIAMKHLLTEMLRTTPLARASMTTVMELTGKLDAEASNDCISRKLSKDIQESRNSYKVTLKKRVAVIRRIAQKPVSTFKGSDELFK